jgi:hypothetical protein
MAKLLIRTVNGENSQRYMRGDVVAVFPDSHEFGRLESLAVWVAEGRNKADWPGGFAIIEIEGLAVEDARQYVEEVFLAGATTPVIAQRRRWTLDYTQLERRETGGGRDTLNTEGRIKRRWSDADVPGKFRVKG